MKRWLGPALACLALACHGERLVGASGDIHVAPESLEFPRAWVGYPTTATVTVENTGRAPADLQAQVDGGFGLEEPPKSIPGPGTVDLVLSFAPAQAGSAAGTLVIHAGGKRFEVPVVATALPPPECTTAQECRIAHFDPTNGSCVSDPAPDDTACSSHCVSGGRCLDGVCRGATDGCDDGDPCTRDLLADDCSCRHEPLPERPSDDLCHRETCISGVGWKVDNAPDGTVCGPVNECTGQFCRDGACGDAMDAPEGTICREGTPCQKPGRCGRIAGGTMQCLLAGANTVLLPVWRVAPVGDREIRFEAVADDRYLYWAECDDEGCGLRSISPLVYRDDATGIDPDPSDFEYEAFDRWEGAAPMFTGPVAANGGLMLSRGLVFSTLHEGWLEAFDAATGEPAFRLDLTAEGVPLGRGASAVNAFGDVVLLLADAAGLPRTVLAVSPVGAPVWRSRRSGAVRGLVADEDGNVFFSEETGDRSLLVSLDGSGRDRFAVYAPPDPPLAAFGGRVLKGDGTLRATLDGTVIGARLPLLVPEWTLPPVLSPPSDWLAGYPVGETGPDWTSYSFLRFHPVTAEVQGNTNLSSASSPWDRSEPILVNGNAVVIAEGSGVDSCGSRPRLRELRWDAPAPWSCELTPGSYGGPATVLSSLWIAKDSCRGSVAAFLLEVAGQGTRSLGLEGWLGGGGEPGRGARPFRP